MSAEELSAAAGIVLSLVFNYVPQVRKWYDLLDETGKRLVMLGALILVAIAVFVLACFNLLEELGLSITVTALTCDRTGGLTLIRVLIIAIIANQSTFAISPQIKNHRRQE